MQLTKYWYQISLGISQNTEIEVGYLTQACWAGSGSDKIFNGCWNQVMLGHHRDKG